MMKMTFWWGDVIDELVVPGIHVDNPWSLILLCIILVAMCLLYEAIKYHQARIRLAAVKEKLKQITCQPPNESATLLTASELAQQRLHSAAAASSSSSASHTHQHGGVPPPTRIVFADPAPFQRILELSKEAIVFLIQAVLGYFLMLAVMSYNGPIFITITLGMALGYFVFGHFTMDLNWQSQRMHHITFKCSTNCPNGGHGCHDFPNSSSSTTPDNNPDSITTAMVSL